MAWDDPDTLAGRAAEAAGNTAAKTAVHAAADGASGALAGFGASNPFGFAGVVVASIASILVNQTHYNSKLKALREMYKDEAAMQLGKSPSQIKDKDIELLANGDPKRGLGGNKVIAEELQTLKKRRNVGMLVTVSSIILTVAAISAVFAAGGAAVSIGAALNSGDYIGIAGRMVLGFITHRALENPIKKGAKKLFGMDTPTTHERIAELSKQHKKGRNISREQVLSVFVSANKDLSNFVIDNYGMHYDKLSVQQKNMVVDALEQHIPLANLTKNLNSGSVKLTELAFAVEGKISGVAPKTVKHNPTLATKARNALMGVGTRLHLVKQQHNAVAATIDAQKNVIGKPYVAKELDNLPPADAQENTIGKPYLDKKFFKPQPKGSFAERIENERAVMATNISPTIH